MASSSSNGSTQGSTTDTQVACSSSTTSSECESHPIVSLLERLRAPSTSELARKRKINANPPPPSFFSRPSAIVSYLLTLVYI